MITLYHRTKPESAEAILRDGFVDGTATYGTGTEWSGVWLADRPLDVVDIGYLGSALLRVTLRLSEADIDDFEWKAAPEYDPDEGWIANPKGYREWLIPAQTVNADSTIEMLDEESLEEGSGEEMTDEERDIINKKLAEGLALVRQLARQLNSNLANDVDIDRRIEPPQAEKTFEEAFFAPARGRYDQEEE